MSVIIIEWLEIRLEEMEVCVILGLDWIGGWDACEMEVDHISIMIKK